MKKVEATGAVPAMKPEATAIGDPHDGRWKITLSFDGRRFCVPKLRHYTNRLLDFGSLERMIKTNRKIMRTQNHCKLFSPNRIKDFFNDSTLQQTTRHS